MMALPLPNRRFKVSSKIANSETLCLCLLESKVTGVEWTPEIGKVLFEMWSDVLYGGMTDGIAL